nr:RecName: Full=Serum amyloid P-component; Short=SAP [Mustelus canis]
GFPGKSLIF